MSQKPDFLELGSPPLGQGPPKNTSDLKLSKLYIFGLPAGIELQDFGMRRFELQGFRGKLICGTPLTNPTFTVFCCIYHQQGTSEWLEKIRSPIPVVKFA